uniref:Peptidylprolyl isomerase n=1 Tax=uncultured marine crenarchaeote HF4000_APKG6D9 TaxID=455597 RepID=B3T961_9ARCH|nr:hypothetical protein ALOHA_HF4000APKG6D9ctg2g26 [uncultured marine crenarchaeote HF4000_APKG6D9]
MIGLFSTPAFAQQFEDLDYKIRGGEILSFEIDEDTTSLKILIDARARGELIITLPRYLIDAQVDFEDTDFEILVSGLKLISYDEINTPYDRIITIPFKRGNGEFIITGTHVFSQPPVTQTTSQKSMDQIIQSELQAQIPDGQAKLMIFSNTDWSGAFQSSSFDYTEINGNSDEEVTFGCESSFGRQAVFGAKIKKLTQDGYLKIIVIQDQKVIAEGSTEDDFGELLINGNCVSSSSPTGGGCLIATATFGSEMSPQVQQLRELRDNSLLQTESGTLFMKTFNNFYYSFSPIIADYERENPVFKEAVKIVITPLLSSLSILNFVDMNSEAEVLGYGISLIVLNGMMYVGIPIVAVVGIRRIF